MSPEKQRSRDDERDAVVGVPGRRERSIRSPPVSTGPDVISSAEALDELVVAGDVIGVAVGDEKVRRRDALALDRLEERLERRAAVDEDRRPAGLVGEQEGVREPGRVHAPLDDHRAQILREESARPERIAPRPHDIEGGTMNDMFGAREVLEEAADRWWIFLITGIAWLVFALIVFQWDYTRSTRSRSSSASSRSSRA